MINLLPPQYKKELENEENFRLLITIGLAVFVFLVCFFLMLVLVRIYTQEQIQSEKLISSLSPSQQNTNSAASQDLKKANANFSNLLNLYKKRLSPSLVLSHIESDLPQDMTLTSFELSGQGVSTQGFTPTREMLLAFRSNLAKDSLFSHIEFPLTNLVNSRNSMFSIHLTLKELP